MREAYPIILTRGQKYVVVSIPDFDINTQGEDLQTQWKWQGTQSD